MKILTIIFWFLFLLVYCFFPDKLMVDQNKLDTLYMVSTIFFSAAIGMVVSNNVHLNNKEYKDEIRKMNKNMTLTFIVCFFLETIAYFIYEESFSHYWGMHLHLVVLGLVFYATLVYIIAMPIVAKNIARIENNDYSEREMSEQNKEFERKQQLIIDICSIRPLLEKDLMQQLRLIKTDELNGLLEPLIDEGILFKRKNQEYCALQYLKREILKNCNAEPTDSKELAVKIMIEIEEIEDILQELVATRQLIYRKEGYSLFNDDYFISRILQLCEHEALTRFQIFKELNIPNARDNYSQYIKPLIDQNLLRKESGTGYGSKYITIKN